MSTAGSSVTRQHNKDLLRFLTCGSVDAVRLICTPCATGLMLLLGGVGFEILLSAELP